jgi:hypothetical protein
MKYRKYPNWVIITNKEIPFPYSLITDTNGKVLISATLRNGLYLVDSFALITTRSGCPLTPSPSIVIETPSEVEQSPGDEISLESTEILTPAAPDTSAGPKACFRKDNLEVKRSDSIAIWHRRLAHLHPSAMKKLLNIPLHGKNDISGCDTCIQAKHQQKFQQSVPSTHSTVAFELIHSDLCGPLNHSVGVLNRGISQGYGPATSVIERRDISGFALRFARRDVTAQNA